MESELTFYDLLELSKEPKLTHKLLIRVNSSKKSNNEATVTRIKPFTKRSLEVGYKYPTGWSSYTIVTLTSIIDKEVIIYAGQVVKKQKRGRNED